MHVLSSASYVNTVVSSSVVIGFLGSGPHVRKGRARAPHALTGNPPLKKESGARPCAWSGGSVAIAENETCFAEVTVCYQNLNLGQDTHAEPTLEGRRNQIGHSEGRDASVHGDSRVQHSARAPTHAHHRPAKAADPSARSSTSMTSGSCCLRAPSSSKASSRRLSAANVVSDHPRWRSSNNA